MPQGGKPKNSRAKNAKARKNNKKVNMKPGAPTKKIAVKKSKKEKRKTKAINDNIESIMAARVAKSGVRLTMIKTPGNTEAALGNQRMGFGKRAGK